MIIFSDGRFSMFSKPTSDDCGEEQRLATTITVLVLTLLVLPPSHSSKMQNMGKYDSDEQLFTFGVHGISRLLASSLVDEDASCGNILGDEARRMWKDAEAGIARVATMLVSIYSPCRQKYAKHETEKCNRRNLEGLSVRRLACPRCNRGYQNEFVVDSRTENLH